MVVDRATIRAKRGIRLSPTAAVLFGRLIIDGPLHIFSASHDASTTAVFPPIGLPNSRGILIFLFTNSKKVLGLRP